MSACVRVPGVRCTSCGYVAAFEWPRCPLCRGRVDAAAFGPEGVIWSSTVVHAGVPGRESPYALAYVDLDRGPRVLAHTPGASPAAIGRRVRLCAVAPNGDIRAVVVE